jgi:hypothetical protein
MFLSRFGCFYGSTLHKDWLTNHITEIKYFWKRIGICMAVLCLKSNQMTRFLEKNRKLYGSIMFKVESEYGNNTLFGNNWKLYGSTVILI